MLVRKPARIFRRKPNQLVFLEDLEDIAGKKRSLPTASLVVLALVAGLLGGVLGGDATKGLISSGVNLVSSTSTNALGLLIQPTAAGTTLVVSA